MNVIIFGERLRRLLEENEGTILLDRGYCDDGGYCEQEIRKLHTNIIVMMSFLLHNEDYINRHLLHTFKRVLYNDYSEETDNSLELLCEITSKMIHFAHESEKIMDIFLVNRMHQKSRNNLEESCVAFYELQEDMLDIQEKVDLFRAKHTSGKNITAFHTGPVKVCSSSGAMKRKAKDRIPNKPRMVGQEDEMEKLLDLLIEGQPLVSVISIVGSSGLTKTTLASVACDCIFSKNYFDCRAWVTMSFKFNPNMFLEEILKSVMPSYTFTDIMDKDYELKKITEYIRNKKYLVVRDDIKEFDVWDALIWTLPDDQNGSRIPTTADEDMILGWVIPIYIRLLNHEECYAMLNDRILGQDIRILWQESFQLDVEAHQTMKSLLRFLCCGLPYGILFFKGFLFENDIEVVQSKLEWYFHEACYDILDYRFDYRDYRLDSCDFNSCRVCKL